MNPISAIIVDDEIEGINTLDYMLKEYCPNVHVIGKFQSSVEALKSIKKQQPTLLFLDIQMPQINGLELLELVGINSFNAIFTTAYDEYVLPALRLNALDYLRKPVEGKELQEAIKRVKPIVPEQVLWALELYKNNSKVELQTPFGIKVGSKIKFLRLIDICYCESDGNFTHIHLENGSKTHSSHPLIELSERLPEKYFFRVQRYFVINIYHVTEYDRKAGGSVKLRCGKTITVPRSRREALKAFLDRFLD